MPELLASVLLGIVLASGIGALIVCALLLRYGHVPEIDETPRGRARRLFVTRIGHATAVTCFAVCALLALAALGRAQRAARAELPLPPGATAETEHVAGTLREQTARLRAEVDELTARVSRTEAHGASSNGRARPSARVSAAVSAAPRDAAPAPHDAGPAPSHAATQLPGAIVADAPRPVVSVPAPVSAPAESAPASPRVEASSPNVSPPEVPSPEAPPAAEARTCGGEAPATGAGTTPPRSRGAVVADCVQDWVKGEAREFRDGVRREIGEFRHGFARVRRTPGELGGWLRGEENRSDR